jgi:hypothetical protein
MEWEEGCMIEDGGHKKNFKINFAGVLNNATFAVPTKTGKTKQADGAMPRAIQDERFTLDLIRD